MWSGSATPPLIDDGVQVRGIPVSRWQHEELSKLLEMPAVTLGLIKEWLSL